MYRYNIQMCLCLYVCDESETEGSMCIYVPIYQQSAIYISSYNYL